MASARKLYPDRIVQFLVQSEDDPRLWSVTLTPTPDPTEDYKSVTVDARTGKVVGEYKVGEGFMDLMFRLHVDLFAGLPGKLFLGFMGLLLLVALVSGVVLYAPFMRKLDFGTVRRERSTRVRWLDLHNLLGIVTLVWCFVVGATGMINTWADLLIKYWQYEHVGELLKPYKGQALVPEAERLAAAALAGGGQSGRAGQEPLLRRLPWHVLLQPAPQHLLHAWRYATDVEAAAAGAGGRAHGQGDRRAADALVSRRAADLPAAALRRLRRPAHEDHLGAAGHRHHRRAGQRAVPLAEETQARSDVSHQREWWSSVTPSSALIRRGGAWTPARTVPANVPIGCT